MRKTISKIGNSLLIMLMAISCILPTSLTTVSALGGGLSQYGTFYPEHNVTWYDGTGYGSSVPSFSEGGNTYYQDGSIVELSIKLPVNNQNVGLADDIYYDPSKVELLSSYIAIGSSQDIYYSTNGWSAYVVGETISETSAVIHYVNDVQYLIPDTHTDTNAKIAKIYFKVKSGVATDAGTNINFTFPKWQVTDKEFNFMTPNYDPTNSAGTYFTACDPVTIQAKNPSITFNASNGFITQSEARALNTASDLKPYNNVNAQLGDGSGLNVTTTTANFTGIKNGTLGSYNVTYSYNYNGLSDTKTVSLTVVEDGTIISPDGVNALYAKDGILTQSQAKSLANTSELININGAYVKVNDGSSAIPIVESLQFTSIKNGVVGDYAVTYSYGSGTSQVTKTVNLSVVPDGSIISPNKDFALYAKDGFIRESQAKALANKDELRSYNSAVVYLASGGTTNPVTSVSSNNWAEIKSGEKATYAVYYSYGNGTNETEKQVGITVVGDNDVISNNGKYSLAANDLELTVSEAKKLLNKEELINLAKASVTEVGSGNSFSPQVSVSNFTSIQNGTIGTYNVTFSYGSGDDAVSKTITLKVSKDPVHEIIASNGSISQTDAKNLTSKEDLIPINGVVVNAIDGTHPQANVSAVDYLSIKAGIVGTYSVTYSYGSGSLYTSTTVKVNVYKDGSVVNDDASLYAKDALIKQSEAKALTNREALMAFNDASVTLNDGTHPTPNVNVSTGDWLDIKDGTKGTYDVTYSYATTHGQLSKTVKITVVEDGSEISSDKTASIYAEDGFIRASQAKKLTNKNDVSVYNNASVTLASGAQQSTNVVISDKDWLEIKKGTLGSYTVMHTYGSGANQVEKSVQLTIISDDAEISKDGKTSLVAKDGEISNDDAKKINTKEDLIPYNEALVTLVDGTEVKPEVEISAKSLNSIKNGEIGDYTITYTYGVVNSDSYVSKTVKISVVQKTRDVYLFDYNENGIIEVSDKSTFNYYLTNPRTQTPTAILLSDANGNNAIDVSDKASLNDYLTHPNIMPPVIKIPV